jgi:hypothetical protein
MILTLEFSVNWTVDTVLMYLHKYIHGSPCKEGYLFIPQMAGRADQRVIIISTIIGKQNNIKLKQ